MSDVKVTREHRLAALRALGWSDTSSADPWPDTGGDTVVHSNKFMGLHVTNMVEESSVALAIAQAERRVRAEVIADLRGLLQSKHTLDEVSVSVEYIRADSLELYIEYLESQQ